MERSIGTRELKKTILAVDRAAEKAGIKNLRVILYGGLAAISLHLQRNFYVSRKA